MRRVEEQAALRAVMRRGVDEEEAVLRAAMPRVDDEQAAPRRGVDEAAPQTQNAEQEAL